MYYYYKERNLIMEFRKRLVFPLILLALMIIAIIFKPDQEAQVEVEAEIVEAEISTSIEPKRLPKKQNIIRKVSIYKSNKIEKKEFEKVIEIEEIEVEDITSEENMSSISSQSEQTTSPASEEEEEEYVNTLPFEAPKGEKINCTEEEVELLAHLVFAEANVWYNPETERGEYCSDDWQSYVALVALNRVKSDIYPSNLHDVIFQRGQYACTWNGSFEWTPDERAYRNVRRALEGEITLPENVLFQAEFEQGSGVYVHIGNTYFCYL